LSRPSIPTRGFREGDRPAESFRHPGGVGPDAGRVIGAYRTVCLPRLHRAPLIAGKVGMSLDGRIAPRLKKDGWITSTKGREFGQDLRLRSDALLVGIGTLLADDPELTYRGKLPKARPLIRIVLDSMLRTPPGARILKSVPSSPLFVFCLSDAPAGRKRALRAAGAEVLTVPRDVREGSICRR